MAAQLAAGVLSVRFCQVTIVPEVPEWLRFSPKWSKHLHGGSFDTLLLQSLQVLFLPQRDLNT